MLRECRGINTLFSYTGKSGHGDTAGCPNSPEPVPSTSSAGTSKRGGSKCTNNKAKKLSVKRQYAKGMLFKNKKHKEQEEDPSAD